MTLLMKLVFVCLLTIIDVNQSLNINEGGNQPETNMSNVHQR